MNVADVVLHNALRRPDHPALEHGTDVVTYGVLAARTRDLAQRFVAAGLVPGGAVGLSMGDSIDHVVTLLALFLTGAVPVPLDVRWTATEKRAVLAAFEACAVVVDAGTIDLGVPQLVPSRLPPGAAFEARPTGADAPLLMSLSSGTTGLPKGPRITHRQFLLRMTADWIGLGFHHEDRFLCATPLYFGGGRGFTLAHLLGGATVVLQPPPYDTEALVATLGRSRITSLFLVPTVLRRLLAAYPDATRIAPTLRLVISSGAALHPDERAAVKRLLTPNLYNLYGTTESGVISLLGPDADGDAAASVGRPPVLAGFEVVDEADRLVLAGTVGHIRQRAPWLPDGFWNNPEATAASFRHGCYYPGDLGRIDATGHLYITGRSKDMIIRGGINIYPEEIERALALHPLVVEAAVIGAPSADLGEEIVAFVTLRAAVDVDVLRRACADVLAPYKMPQTFVVLDDLPRNSGGKVQKAALAERHARLREAALDGR